MASDLKEIYKCGEYAFLEDASSDSFIITWEGIQKPCDTVMLADMMINNYLQDPDVGSDEIVAEIQILGMGWYSSIEITAGIYRKIYDPVALWDIVRPSQDQMIVLSVSIELPEVRIFSSATAQFKDATCSFMATGSAIDSLIEDEAIANWVHPKDPNSFKDALRQSVKELSELSLQKA